MKGKKTAAWILAGCLTLSLAGCAGKEGAVYVQSVSSLTQMGGIAPGDRFSGMVVSENVTEIQKDGDKVIDELLVKEGDEVKQGQKLFSYDTEQLQLSLDKQMLEKEQLEISIENYTAEIERLEKYRQWAGPRDQLQYTVQIQSNQVDLKEAELNLKTKTGEIAKSENLLANSVVKSPVAGRVTSVSENGTDNYGNPLPYITIQQTGSYRVKGMLNELQRGGLMEGDRLRMESRTDPNAFWLGTVTLVDYDNPTQGSSNNMMYMGDTDEMSSSSRYPFYVELDNVDGLLLGQHLYISLDLGEETEDPGLAIGSFFICYDGDGSNYVWAENGGRLEKRTVTVGEYDPMRDVFYILEGLTESDYVAFPDEAVCVPGAPVTHTQPSGEGGVK